MSLFNMKIGGAGGASASIFAYGDQLQSTDTVYAENGSTRVNGVWNSARSGFEIAPIRGYGTWVLTATYGGNTKTINVLVDAAEELAVNVSNRIFLYNLGDECTDITGGWIAATDLGLDSGWDNKTPPTVTKNTDNVFLRQTKTDDNGGVYRTVNRVLFSGYSDLCFELEANTSNQYAGVFLLHSVNLELNNNIRKIKTTGTARMVLKQNIEDYQYDCYVGVYLYYPSDATVYKIWLE